MENHRNPLIDALRGFSILFVVLQHSSTLVQSHPVFNSLPREGMSFFFQSGYYGVRVFFVISGFLITSMAIRRWGVLSELNIRDFYLFRFARIAPLLLLLLFVLSLLHFSEVKFFVLDTNEASYFQTLWAALAFHINRLKIHINYLPPSWTILWSLSVEEVFYFFFPWICWLNRRRGTFFAALVALIFLGPIYRLWKVDESIKFQMDYLSCMDSMAMGCLAALIVSKNKFSQTTLRALGFLGAATMIFVLLFKLEEFFKPVIQWQLGVSFLSLGAVFFLIFCSQISIKRRVARWLGPFIFLGKWSYEIYLTHLFIIFLVGVLLPVVPVVVVSVFSILIFCVLGSVLLGYLVGKTFSDPLNHRIRAWRKPSSFLGSV